MFSTEGILISASAAPNCGNERERERGGGERGEREGGRESHAHEHELPPRHDEVFEYTP